MWLLSLLPSLMLLLVPVVAHADVNDFTVTNFTADYYLSKADPQGKLAVRERLSVDFTSDNHGILRAIPKKYNGQDQHVKVTSVRRDGQTEMYSTYTSNGNEVLKIGNPNQTITGPHTYAISYSTVNVIRFDNDHNELIWNTNGTQWTRPFLAETATLHIANDVKAFQGLDVCFTGAQGSHAQHCTVDRQGQTTIFKTTQSLSPGETMTFFTDFPRGTFHKPTAVDWWQDNGAKVILGGLLFLVPSLLAYRKWQRDGKDLKGRGTIIPEYTPPDGLRAAEADAILHYSVTNKGISATLIDLAIRRHLKIVESRSKGVLGLGKHDIFSFEKLETSTDVLSDYEQELYYGLFRHGSTVTIKDLQGKYYTSVSAAKGLIRTHLTEAGYLYKYQVLGWWLWLLGIGEFVLAGFLHSWASLGAILGGIIVLIFACLMQKRPQKGVDAKDALEGLKMYMNTAEKERLKMLQSVKAPYAEQSVGPEKTVELFEKLLPFAIVLGVEKSWAKQFESIYATPPDWYSGNWTAFNTGYLVGSLNESMIAMNTSFATPGSSGAGGGGGFAGGGGGGGGGGGW